MSGSLPLRPLSIAAALAAASDLARALEQLEERFLALEPSVHAFVPEEGRFVRLRQQCVDLERRQRESASDPLLGVPIGVKDIFHVDGLPTRAGSRLEPEVLAGGEAEAVTALRRAGALVVGKTVSTEFAYFAPGPTRNPHDPAHTPGGSSSGSAAAVAAGLCAAALGTQTIGSIVRPAAYCGVVGYKPTFGRISTRGVIPLSPSLDHVGTFTVDVADAATLARLLCEDWRPATIAAKKPVLGIPAGPYLDRAGDEAREHFERLCERLALASYRIERPKVMADFEAIVARHELILAAEARRIHRLWFERFGDQYHHKTRELLERGATVSSSELSAALPGRKQLRRELAASAAAHGIDLWISPAATGPAPAGLTSTGDPVMSLPWTHAGLPSVSLPAGEVASRLPLGLQLAAGWYDDEPLLAWAAQLEPVLGEVGADGSRSEATPLTQERAP